MDFFVTAKEEYIFTESIRSGHNALTHISAFSFLKNITTVFPWLCSCSGGDLSSRTVASQVFSALQSLTSVFGMGTGVSSA